MKEIEVWGDGSPTREFLYVEDAAEGILLAAENYNGPEPVNLGSGLRLASRNLVELIANLTGYKGSLFGMPPNPMDNRAGHWISTVRDNYFGFQAKMGFEEGLKKYH